MSGQPFDTFWLGELSLESMPYVDAIKEPNSSNVISAVAATIVILGAAALVAVLTRYGLWRSFWRNWLTSLDAKKIGIMYIVIALVMLFRGVIEAALMRTQQMLAVNQGGPLSPDHFAQMFTTHGTIMIFFMAMPFLIGVINVVMPLQIGARDVRFPLMNAISLALTAAGGVLIMASLVLGEFSTGGWSGYAPYTEAAFNPGVGVDY